MMAIGIENTEGTSVTWTKGVGSVAGTMLAFRVPFKAGFIGSPGVRCSGCSVSQGFEGLYTVSSSLSREAAAVPEHGFFDLAALPEHHNAAASQVLLFNFTQV